MVEPPAETRTYRGWMLFLLASINILMLADRQGIAAAAPAIKAELRLTDTQIGLILGFGFAILYTMLGLPIARLAERRSRARIIAASVAIFALFVAVCSQARSFATLMLARVGVGVGDAGFTAPFASLTGDHYPADRRTAATTIVWLGAPVGALFGAMGGAMIVQDHGWRAWFLVLAAPSMVIALLCFLSLREPPRGRFDRAVADPGAVPSMTETMHFLFGKKSMRHVAIGCGLGAVALNGLGQFLARFMIDAYGISLVEAGRTLGLLAVGAMASGLALGGFGVSWASRFDERWAVWAPAAGLLIAAPMFFLAAFQDTLAGALPYLAVGHVALFVFFTPTVALAQNMVGADMRASSSFVIAFVLGLVGTGLGPTLMGLMSDAFANHQLAGFAKSCPGGIAPVGAGPAHVAACAQASRTGISNAIAGMSLILAWAAVHYAMAARDLRQDLATHYQG